MEYTRKHAAKVAMRRFILTLVNDSSILDEETILDEEPHRWISHQSGLVYTSVAIQLNEDSIIFTEEDVKSQRNFVQNC